MRGDGPMSSAMGSFRRAATGCGKGCDTGCVKGCDKSVEPVVPADAAGPAAVGPGAVLENVSLGSGPSFAEEKTGAGRDLDCQNSEFTMMMRLITAAAKIAPESIGRRAALPHRPQAT